MGIVDKSRYDQSMNTSIDGIKMVSIVMPVYNAAEFINDSIDDVLNQTFTDFELICVNDGSTDDTASILEEKAEIDNRIIVIHQANKGGGAARNAGMGHACGKYITFWDADDRFEPDLLELSVEELESNNHDMVVYDGDAFDYYSGEHKDAPWLIKNKNYMSGTCPFICFNTTVWNKIFNREFIEKKGFRFSEGKAAYSTSFSALAMMYASGIGVVNKVLYHYRTNNPNSNVVNEDKDPTAIVTALSEVRNRLVKDGMLATKAGDFQVLCEDVLIQRLRLLRTYAGFAELYNRLHISGIDELGLLDRDGTDKENALNPFTDIRELTLDQYLFAKISSLRKSGIINTENYILPAISDDVRQIVLYGAGNVGKDYFVQIIKQSTKKLVGWVDRNYANYGYPIQSPENLCDMEFDAVIIGVLEEKVAMAIKADVMKKGVSETKVIWAKPVSV
ncbi:glycosyltransferase family 2 protein [Butyrivibrio fibrisolvens]|uniref:Glycosyltransferase 2-like domain-containing protein n=1 Tax=Butyrivibrio fibrisolvens TaxID=831 RepID=A0A317G8X5_BUTFI|nr:glycosyltransferase family 2 protein [Butyrivibrio fibrisolvens]PWT29260.1 hypothetical protein CPT75_20230 [Butyrivibrio fibrisolvens]